MPEVDDHRAARVHVHILDLQLVVFGLVGDGEYLYQPSLPRERCTCILNVRWYPSTATDVNAEWPVICAQVALDVSSKAPRSDPA